MLLSKPSKQKIFVVIQGLSSLHCAGPHQTKIAKLSQISLKIPKPIHNYFELFQTLFNVVLMYYIIFMHFNKPPVVGI